jgi:hypothetical protein
MLQKYKKHDTHIIFNEDLDLKPIEVKLPIPPDPESIIGYGLKPEEQIFKRPPIPPKLFELNKDKKIPHNEKADILREDPEYYEEEIAFIQQEWQRRINGVWYYINGKPTYIPGCFYFYLCYWYLERGFPAYRDRDRKFFIFSEFCDNDPYCYGFVYPKHRREGATTKAACWNYEYVSRRRRVRGGIQSMTEPHAELVFQKHLVPSWKKLVFWFKPVFEGSTSPKSELSMNAPPMRITRTNMGADEMEDLESVIDFKSSDVGGYDASRLERYHGDEVGKTKTVNVYKRHLVARECMTYLDTIIGKAIYTSTAGEMVKGGGEQFKKLILSSDYHNRDDNNKTTSGLYTLFIPADEGFKVDKFGMSLKEESKQYLLNERKKALEDEDYEKLNESTRMYPLRLKDCFRNASDQDNFDMKIIGDMLDKYQFGNSDAVRGDFMWKNGIKDSTVVFYPRENGRFLVSYQFKDPRNANSSRIFRGRKIPGNTNLFRSGGDTFKFKVTESGKKSLGGGATFMNRDHSIDPDDRPIEDWETYRFVATYLHKPMNVDEYCEDMLMMCVYYGSWMVPEINVPAIWEHFERRGYDGYLYYSTDRTTGKLKKKPGFNTGQQEVEDIFRWYQLYIKLHGYRIYHDDLLEQLHAIGEKMGDYDLFAAGGMIGLSLKNDNEPFFSKKEESEGPGITDFMDYR